MFERNKKLTPEQMEAFKAFLGLDKGTKFVNLDWAGLPECEMVISGFIAKSKGS